MAKKKRTGLDALREYEAGSGTAASSATSYEQPQTQQRQTQAKTKSTSFKRSGLDAIREYEQYGSPRSVQDTPFDPNYRSRNDQVSQSAFEAYKAAIGAGTRKDRLSAFEAYKNAVETVNNDQMRGYIRTLQERQRQALPTIAHDQASGYTRTEQERQKQREQTPQWKTVQQDQVRGMRRTSQTLANEIYDLEVEQADTHFSGTGLSENGKSVTQLQDEIVALQNRKTEVDRAAALARAQQAVGALDDADRNLLRQYRGQELNGYTVRAYAKHDALKALKEKGYSEKYIKQLAEFQTLLEDYDNAQRLSKQGQIIGRRNPVGGTLFSAALAPAKIAGNLESLRGILPSWAGGYQNEDMPTNIYSPAYNASRLSSGIRQGAMQGMGSVGQFLYQAGTSALDSAVNMAVSSGLVGAVGGSLTTETAKSAVAETMNWVMGSEVAADSVYEGIQNGKSNRDAMIDGIVEGAIEGITEKYSVGDLIENLLSGKAAWKKVLRAFGSEGAEEVASNWLNRLYDVTARHSRSEVLEAYNGYKAQGMTDARALAAVFGDFAKEDGQSFLAGGLSGLAMSGTYAGVNRVISEANITQTARAVIEAGEVQDVIDYGLAQENGTRAHQLAEKLQQTVQTGGEVTQEAVEDTLREVAREQQNAVEEGQEPRVPETLTRLDQIQAQSAQGTAQNTQEAAQRPAYEIYKDAVQTAQENARAARQYAEAQQRAAQNANVDENAPSELARQTQQAQRAAQQQYDQNSLFAPIDGTEGMGELDVEQYARQQTADAEQALDEAAVQQEEQYLQAKAREAGYDDETASYFLNGNTTGLPAEQYAQSFQRVYEQGETGASEQRAMRFAEGMNQDVAAAAYRAGLAAGQKGVNNGSIEATGEGPVGQAGQRAEGAAGGIQRSTAQRQRADAGRKRAQSARDLAKTWDEVSGAALGLGERSTQTVRVMPKGGESQSEDIKAAAKFLRTAGVENARFFTGQLAQTINGETLYADGAVLEDGTVLIRADSEEYSAFELAKHEGYHILAERYPEMAAKIRQRLLGEGKITREMIESYIDAYNRAYGDDIDAYVEEIIADAYAGMNRTEYGTNQLRADVKMEAGQWQKKAGSARAPPAGKKFSIKTAENGKKYVLVDKQQGRFIGLNNIEAARLAKTLIQDEFAGQTLPLGEYAATTVRKQDNWNSHRVGDRYDGASKYAYDGSQYSEATFRAKMRASANLDEMLETAEYVGHSDDHKNHTFATDGFDYYKTTFVVGGRAFEGTFNIGLSDMGATFYGMTKIEQVTSTGTLASSLVPDAQPDYGDLPKTKIARNGGDVKGKFSTSAGQTENTGAFDKANPDIRYSAQDGSYRDLMGEKPAQYVRGLERRLVNELAENLSVPGQAKRDVLRPMAEEALRTFFTDGQLDRAKLNDLFETAYKAGVEEDRQYIEQYGDLKKFIRDQKISISEKDRQDIADYNLFRKASMGTLTISKDGLPVDVAYQELREMAPELFPADITAPSDQLMQIYDVARGIQKAQKTLDEYYGPQAASFKAWQQANFSESIDRMTSGLRIAQRYLDAQNHAKEKLAIPQTQEETKQMWAQLKDARRAVEKAQGKTLLTEADQKTVNRLLRGETDPAYVAGLENGQQILKVYEAKAEYDMLALKLKAWNVQRRQGLKDFAEQALTEAEAVKWADKAMGIKYQRETMERNIRDIARKGKVSDEKANAFINKYFWPVHENESKRKTYLVEKQDQIRALKLDRHVRKGNLVSESYAVQWLGEAEFNRDYLKQHPRVEKRGGMDFNEWNAAIQEFEKQNPNLDFGKVRGAVKVFHEVYDKLFEDMNRVRIENGYEPVNYLQGYFPHFQEGEEGGSLLQKFARAAGIEGDVSPLPATINGLTASFKPGIRYMANIQNRLGYATAYDALQGFDRYIEVASDVIYHTADIQRLRALATQIRWRASDEALQKRIDAIRMDPFLNPDEANDQIANLTKEGRYALSNLVDELDEYTNLLAGKKSRLDRGMEKMLGRRAYNVMKKFESRVGANMVAANVGSALTNFIPITQAWSQVSTADVLRGMWDTLKNYKTADGLDTASTFINNRSGYGRLAETTMDKVSAGAGWLMESIDTFTTGSVVRARYYQNLRRGMSEANAMQEADQFASGVMADRSKGSTPTLYSARNPLVKLFTQFQLEVNNELSWIFKDMAQEERKKGVAALAKALFKFLIGSWIYNEFYEAVVGRRAALDPLDIINDTVGDFMGYQLPNTVQAAVSGKWDFTKEKPGTYQAIKNFEGNIISEFPGTQALTILGIDEALGLDIDSGRIAVASAIPNLGKIEKALLAKGEDMAPAKKAKTITDELLKPALYVATPFGGGQLRKLYQGATAAAKGGSYSVDNEGHEILQYPVYNDNTKDAVKSWTQAILFGKTATEEAQSWVESGFKSISAKETAAYQIMTAGGADQRESYAFVNAMKKVDDKTAKLATLYAYDIPQTAKTAYYYSVLASDEEREKMDALDADGVGYDAYMQYKQNYFKAYGTQSVSQERVQTILDGLSLTKKQKAAIWAAIGKDWKEENNPYK